MDMQGESTAAALSGESTPAKILHYIFTYLFRKKVDHLLAKEFLDLFMLDEETFMSNPSSSKATAIGSFSINFINFAI
ncbi:MAG: hypothetical protein WBZ36_18935 [Candidatus Nitrosopolaris sp.]